MNPYPTYKPSGIDWLGEIPEQWEVKRVKDLGEYQSGYFIDAEEFDNENRYPVFGGNGLRGFACKYNHDGNYILIGRQGALCGNIKYVSGKFWATEHAVVVYNKSTTNAKWYSYLLEVMNLNQYAISAAQPGLSVEKVRRLMLPFAELSEQSAIATYLDSKTSSIDRKIELLISKANKYKALRRSLINETVCRGLNPDAPLKDSGIEWIGMIPEHWEVKRMKNICNYISRGITPAYIESGVNRVINQATFSKGFFDTENAKYTSNCDKRALAKNEDILIASTGGGVLGKTYFCENIAGNYYADSHVTTIRTDKKQLVSKFLYYFFAINYDLINGTLSKGSTNQTELQLDPLLNFHLCIPPLNEQLVIVNYLDSKTSQIDIIITNIEQQITKLTQLRKSLINDVVTGKIKVTEA